MSQLLFMMPSENSNDLNEFEKKYGTRNKYEEKTISPNLNEKEHVKNNNKYNQRRVTSTNGHY